MKITRKELRKLINESYYEDHHRRVKANADDYTNIVQLLFSGDHTRIIQAVELGEVLGLLELKKHDVTKRSDKRIVHSFTIVPLPDEEDGMSSFMTYLNNNTPAYDKEEMYYVFPDHRYVNYDNSYENAFRITVFDSPNLFLTETSVEMTKRQLRSLIMETFFVNPEGEAIDLSAGDQPLFTDDRVKKMINHPDEDLRSMARKDPEQYRQALNLAAYGYGDEELELTPKEEEIQSLHDEFGVDSDYEYEHVTRDPQPETDWYYLIDQLRPMVEDKIQDAIDSGVNDYAELYGIMSTMPAFRALEYKIDSEAGFDGSDAISYMYTLLDDVVVKMNAGMHPRTKQSR